MSGSRSRGDTPPAGSHRAILKTREKVMTRIASNARIARLAALAASAIVFAATVGLGHGY